MTRGGMRRTDGVVSIGLRGMELRRAKRAQDCRGLRTGGKRLRHGRSERGHQDREQSDETSELADEATAHEADVGFQSGV